MCKFASKKRVKYHLNKGDFLSDKWGVPHKEEQECRIIKIKKHSESDKNPPKHDIGSERFYVNYLPLTKCVNKIYFGPKASGMELFQNLLTFEKGFESVVCYRSTSPLA